MTPFQRIIHDAASSAFCSDLDSLHKLCEESAKTGKPPIDAILDADLVDESAFLKGLSNTLELDWHDNPPEVAGVQLLPSRVAVRNNILGVRNPTDPEQLPSVLCYNPFDLLASQAAAQELPGGFHLGMTTRSALKAALRASYGVGAETFEEIIASGTTPQDDPDELQESTNLDADDSEAAVVRFVNHIIREALAERATDIHVEPLEDDLQIRYRVDGMLRQVPVPDRIKMLQGSVISRIKIMAHLDIAERRLPQDGRINLELEGLPIDVRVATIPSINGESVSLRLLGQQRFDFSKLGMPPAVEQSIRSLIAQPNGIILVTGPTGCGKSTTLYTFLSALNTKERRIVTIEDPVENKLPGVIQIPTRAEIGLTFASALRSILRGDPNVIMVGEMRDFETGEIAIRAALTGHLVFSTLHTNDAVGGITRLLDMNIEPFLVATSVRAFLAQRLVRVLCPRCSEPTDYSEQHLHQLGVELPPGTVARKAVGCRDCRNTGYQGRQAIFEICMVTNSMQEAISERRSTNDLRAIANRDGMITLRRDGWRLVALGRTSIEEVIRVTAGDAA